MHDNYMSMQGRLAVNYTRTSHVLWHMLLFKLKVTFRVHLRNRSLSTGSVVEIEAHYACSMKAAPLIGYGRNAIRLNTEKFNVHHQLEIASSLLVTSI